MGCSQGFDGLTEKKGRRLLFLSGLGEEDACLVHKGTYAWPYMSRMKLTPASTLLSLSLCYCTCAHTTRTIRCGAQGEARVLMRTRSSTHEEGQRFEQALHVTSVHGVSEMPPLHPPPGTADLGRICSGSYGPWMDRER
jgi:hypothetical protein